MNGEKKTERTESRTEIHKTEFVDKQMPTIFYEKGETKSSTESKYLCIKVSDKSSEAALKTFKKVREEVVK